MKFSVFATAVLSLFPSMAFCFAPAVPHQRNVISRTLNAGPVAKSFEEDLEMTRKVINDFNGDDGEEKPALTRQVLMGNVNGKITSPSTSDPQKVYKSPSRPENDLMIRAAFGETVEKTPIWLFRQAGRHLPEYTAYKKETGRNFVELLKYPESVAECTLQPVRRYDVDAAILFSDILVIAEALGIEVTMPGGVGILIPDPLSTPEEVSTRIPSIDEIDDDFVKDRLGHVLEAVRQIRAKMKEEGKSIPLIGFSAAPWTLLFYMVGGSSRKNTEVGMKWLKEYPDESQKLLDILTKIVIEYMSLQVENGAHMLQVFEAMGMMIDEENFDKFALPCLQRISTELKSRFPCVPLMVFGRGASFANEKLSRLEYDVVTIDGSVDRNTARDSVGDRVCLQGNYDPRELIEDEEGTKTVETVRATARQMLEALHPQKLIANLGEGLGGKESTKLVDAFVNSIHKESSAIISAAADK